MFKKFKLLTGSTEDFLTEDFPTDFHIQQPGQFLEITSASLKGQLKDVPFVNVAFKDSNHCEPISCLS